MTSYVDSTTRRMSEGHMVIMVGHNGLDGGLMGLRVVAFSVHKGYDHLEYFVS